MHQYTDEYSWYIKRWYKTTYIFLVETTYFSITRFISFFHDKPWTKVIGISYSIRCLLWNIYINLQGRC